MQYHVYYSSLLLVILLVCCINHNVESFSSPSSLSSSPTTTSTTTALHYQYDATATTTLEKETTIPVQTTTTITPTRKINIQRKQQKPCIEEITSLDELQNFLEEDEDDKRPVVIKFHAKWCKKCQRIGAQFNRLAMEQGDRFNDGSVRFASIEYTPESQAFITEDLRVIGLPTIQIYTGTKKLFEVAGSSSSPIKRVREELVRIEDIMEHDPEEFRNYANDKDDGILSTLIEESLYDFFDDDSPDFLNEEW